MVRDIPMDFKIEHDRLINEIESPLKRLSEILLELRMGSEDIFYNGFKLTITINKQRNNMKYFNFKSVSFWSAIAEAAVNIARAGGIEIPPFVDGLILSVFGIGIRKAID